MDWKNLFKHALIMSAILVVFGIIYVVLLDTVFIFRFFLMRAVNWWYWFLTALIIVVFPLAYSYFIKKSIKELLVLVLLFLVLSSTISLLFLGATREVASNSNRFKLESIYVGQVFAFNPLSALATPICMPYNMKLINARETNDVVRCPLDRHGVFVTILILAPISFILIALSMIAGTYLSRIKFKKEKIKKEQNLL